jgi:lauroyl/myristoyl acyltransferase
MDDIRKINYKNRLNRRAKFSVFLKFLKNNWVKILIVILLLCLILFPESVGTVVGEWFNKLVSAFIEKITF